MTHPLNTASLFQTSLRQWQADWKARNGGDAPLATAVVARRLLGASPTKRLGRRRATQTASQGTRV